MRRVESLLQLMACLTTHPSDLKVAMRNPRKFITEIDGLSVEDRTYFVDFFKTYSKQFQSATLLLLKKRWEEIEQACGFCKLLLSSQQLQAQWELYIDSYSLSESIPENPLRDALNFILFIQKQCDLPVVSAEIVEYQVIKLGLLLNLEKYDSQENIKHIQQIENTYLVVNESVVIKNFTYKISKLIVMIDKKKMLPKELDDYTGNECLAMFKNYSKNLVTTIILTKYTYDLLDIARKGKSILCCYNILLKKYPLQMDLFKRNIDSLQKLGILALEVSNIKEVANA